MNQFEIELIKKFSEAKLSGVGGYRNEMRITDDSDALLNGECGELAFCKLFNCYPDLSLDPQSSDLGTDLGDVVLFGRTIDVKTTRYETGRLIVRNGKKVNGDYCALMTGHYSSGYTFKGMIRQDLVIVDCRLKNFHGNTSYVVEQNELRIFDEIKNR